MRGILGADIFINLLLVFIITTGLLLMNSNRPGKTGETENRESSLLKINLPKGGAEGLPAGRAEKVVNLSAKKAGEGIQYFLEDRPVALSGLVAELKARKAVSVKVRFDREISYGKYVEVLDICKQAGIRDIANVYATRN